MKKGEALQPTEEQLAQSAEIQPQDIEAAKDLWRRDAPPAFKDLLDAEPEED